MADHIAMKIPLLKDSYESWRGWKVHQQVNLFAEDLWEIVGTGQEIRPVKIDLAGDNSNHQAVQARNMEIAAFDGKITRAIKILVTNISSEMFYLWKGTFPANPRTLWVDLTNHFQQQTHSHRVSVRSQLDSLTLRDRADPESWIKQRTHLYQQYALSGPEIPESEQCMETLNLLPSQWRDFRNMMTFGIAGALTMQLLMQKLVDYNRSNKFPGATGRSPEQQAHLAGWRGGGRGGGRGGASSDNF